MTIKLGGTIYIAIDVTGIPKPAVNWFHGEQRVVEGTYVTMEYHDRWAYVKIKGVKKQNAGNYLVVAENLAGKDEALFKVNVQSKYQLIWPKI